MEKIVIMQQKLGMEDVEKYTLDTARDRPWGGTERVAVHFASFTSGVACGESLGYRIGGEREGEMVAECRRSEGMGSVRIGTGMPVSKVISSRRTKHLG